MLLKDTVFSIVDLETTGLGDDKGPGKDKVVEFASVKFKLGEPLTWVHSLINPQIPIPAEASAQHHLTDEDVLGAPLIDEFLKSYQWNCDCSVAHNAVFDTKFIQFSEPVLCSRRLFQRMYPECSHSSNQFVRYFFGLKKIEELEQIGASHAHRALYDAIVTTKNLEYMINLLLVGNPDMTLQDVVNWTLQPSLLKYVGFGKHKGMLWANVPRDYMDYALNNFKDLDSDMKFTLNHYLTL